VRDEPLSADEVEALPGTFDSDEGTVEQFVRGGKLRFLRAGAAGDGVPLRRQAEYVYAVEADVDVRSMVRDGRATWGELYVGGLMLDAKRRAR
jgi:hypothetical protein